MENKIREEYKNLSTEMKHYNELYEAGNPEITDYEYDMMMQKLKKLEKDYPELKEDSSPSQKAGSAVKRNVENIVHDVPMLSIEDVFMKEDVSAWVAEVKRMHPDATFCVEQKIDGLSMSLRYSDEGKLIVAETRGDGAIGEVVTANAEVIEDVPKKIHTTKELEVRGEVYMRHDVFDSINAEEEAAGRKLFANPRNCAAGTLRQLDCSITKKRNLSFFVFNVQRSEEEVYKEQLKGLHQLFDLGFRSVPSHLCETEEEILKTIDDIGELRGNLPYDIDGAVIKINQIEYRKDFPAGSKYSSGHIAYKYPPEEKETIVRDIEVSVGMTGKLCPVAVFDPIRLCGTTVTRATLHNQDFINELHIGIGDTIIVYKSGEIIPKIKGSVSEKRPKGVHDFVLPEKCPSCGSLTIREEGSADVKCINPLCPAQKLRKIINFVERDSMDIKGLGYEVINKLIQFNYINSIPDLYNLKDKRNELISSGVVGREKAVDNLLAAIEKSKENEPWRVIAGLGISQVGKTLGKQMMGIYFSSIDEIANSSIMKLSQIPNVGIITAKAIYNFFHSEAGAELISKLKSSGINMENRSETKTSGELSGLTFVITGDVHVFKNRNELTDFIEAHGGKCSGSVSKKTEALINNDSASQSSKNVKANGLGIKILTEESFLENYNLSK